MKRFGKKAISIMLVLMMVISMLPIQAFAEDDILVTRNSENESSALTNSSGDIDTSDDTDASEGLLSSDMNETQPETSAKKDDAGVGDTSGQDTGSKDIPVEMPAFEPETVMIDGVIITVSAPEGVFPEGSVLSVNKVSKKVLAKVEEAIEDERDEDNNVAVSYTFDICVLDKDGNEIQPTDGSKAKVSFATDEVNDENLETNVYHISEDENTGELEAEALKVIREVTEETGEETTATVETEGFSFYTVEFTYLSKQYILHGDESVAISDILNEVGLTGEVENVEVSNNELFSASIENGEWMIHSHQAFTSEEWMKVTIGNVVYDITVTDDHVHGDITFTEWTNTSSLPNTAGNYYLTDDVELVSKWTPVDGIKLCLNGHGILMTGNDSVISVGSGRTLSLYDCCENGSTHYITMTSWHGTSVSNTGSVNPVNSNGSGVMRVDGGFITGGNVGGYGSGINVSGGTLNIYGGSIVGNNARDASGGRGGGVYIENNGIVNMSGGCIAGNRAEAEGGGVYMRNGSSNEFNFSGGKIYGNLADSTTGGGNGGGVWMNSGTFTMSGSAVIAGNRSKTAGGGVRVDGGTFVLRGGMIGGSTLASDSNTGVGHVNDSGITDTGNYAGSAAGGIGVWYSNSSFNVNPSGPIYITGNRANTFGGGFLRAGGATSLTSTSDFPLNIRNNYAATYGGGVCLRSYGGNPTVSIGPNVIIKDNQAQNGGGVGLDPNDGSSALTITGGEITDNSATENGGGVYVPSRGTFNLNGNPTISENTKGSGSGSTTENVYLAGSKKINVTGNLSNTTPIGVTLANAGVFTSGLSDKGDASNFSSDNASYAVTLNASNEAQLVPLRTVTITEPSNGTLTVKKGDDAISSGSKVAEGTSLTVTAAPANGYYLSGLTYTPSGSSPMPISSGGSFTISSDTTIEATFTAKTKEATPNATFEADGADCGTLSNVSNGMKYSLDGGGNWVDITGTTLVIASGITADSDIQVYQPSTGVTKLDSDKQTIDVTKATAPTLVATQPSEYGGKGSIPTTTAYQKSTDGTAWENCSGTWSNLDPGTYYVRVKPSGTTLASDSQTITIKEVLASPTFSPGAGSYTAPKSVTISCATNGATIYYTKDGTNPKNSSTKQVYSYAISLDSDTTGAVTTIKAYATKDGAIESQVVTAEYTVYPAHGHDEVTFEAWTDELAKSQTREYWNTKKNNGFDIDEAGIAARVSAANAENTLPYKTGNYYLIKDAILTNTFWNVDIFDTGVEIKLCLKGHSIIGDSSSMSPVSISSLGKLELFDCDTTVHNYYKDSDGVGCLMQPGDTTHTAAGSFMGGYITTNYAGLPLIQSSGKFVMHGGTLIGSNAQDYGCVVVSHTDDEGKGFFMHGGSIIGNVGRGAVYVISPSKFTMTGGEIRDNLAKSDDVSVPPAGGVLLENEYAVFSVSGKPFITGNKKADGSASNVAWLNNDPNDPGVINITGELNTNARIGVSLLLDDEGELSIPIFTTGLDGKGKVSNFTSDNETYTVGLDDTSKEAKFMKIALTGVKINGSAKYGETLSAELTGDNNETPTGTITYEWLRDDQVISGAVGSSYTLVEADIGHTITLRVTQTDPANVKTAFTPLVTKADGSSAKPTLTIDGISKTENSITVTDPVNGSGKTYEYSKDGGITWQDSNIFGSLTPETPYTIVVREKGTSTRNPGAASNPLIVHTDAHTLVLDGVTIRNLSTGDGSTDSVTCGQTLQAVVTETGVSGVNYQWKRDGADISGATESTYIPSADDVGKTITVTAKKESTQITASATAAVTKAPAPAAPILTFNNITKTNNTITVVGFKNNEAKSIVYEYSKDDGHTWQISNDFTGLNANTPYTIKVHIKGTDARYGSEASNALSVTTEANPYPFTGQTPSVIMADYAYGSTPSEPELNIVTSIGANTIYYWSSDGFKNSDENTAGKVWSAEKPTQVGTYYIRAVISGDNYTTFVTDQTMFKVRKAVKNTDVIISNIDAATLVVTLENVAGKKLEYAVIQGGTNLADAAWSSISPGEDSFTIDRVLSPDQAKLYVREKEDSNYEASTPVSRTFTPTVYTVSYDANGGTGSVPDPMKQVDGQNVVVDTVTKPERTGYDFLGWNNDPNATAAMTGTTVNSATTLYAIWNPHTYSVIFDEKDGSDVTDRNGIAYDQEFIIPSSQKASFAFAGWSKTDNAVMADYAPGQVAKNLTAEDGKTVTLYAVWTEVADIRGTVKSGEGENVSLKLMRGNTQFGETKIVALDPDTSGYKGNFIFEGVPLGIYNLVLEQVIPLTGTTDTELLTETIKIEVSQGGTVTIDSEKLKLPASTRSILQVKGADTPQAVVDGLDDLAKDEAVIGRDVTVTMTISEEKKQTLPPTATAEEKETQEDIDKLENKAESVAGNNVKVSNIDFFSINITKEETINGNVVHNEPITNTGDQIMEISFPYMKPGNGAIRMFGVHEGGEAQEIAQNETRAENTFFFDKNWIHLFRKDFSTFAISYTETSGGGGGGGTPTPSYTPVITQPEHGTITVSPTQPKSGENVTVTVAHEEGYETENVIVKNKDGNTVPVTKNTDGTFTFTQPSTGPVTIEAIVKQSTDLTPVIKKPEHGTISANPAKPKAGESVIVIVTPDEGYEVDSVTVTDKDGNHVEVTKNVDGTYSFVQPASGYVTIEAVLKLKDGVVVRFDLNDKIGTAPDPQTFAKGGKAVRPNDPTTEGYKFTDWYTEKECKNVYDFDTPVNEDLILYAGWEKKEEPGPDDNDFGIYFTELFDDPYDGVHYNAKEDRYEIVYTGTNIKPLIRVTSKADGVLKEGIDYTVSYSNNKNVSKPNKPATIRVNGKGFYKSKKVLELYILPADLEEANAKGLLAGAAEFKVLKDNKLNPVIVYRGYKLAGKDFEVSNKNKITGDTTTDITGNGNFSGTVKDVPVKAISKDDQKNGEIKVNLKPAQHVYNGKAHKLSVTTADAVGELTVTAGSSKIPLIEDTDFIVSYSGNILAGKATVTITGIGKCNGTVAKNFTIQPDKTIDITAELADSAPVNFNVRGAQPDIKVTAHRKAEGETVTDEVLVEGRDYKVSYSSNKKIGKGVYTVKFTGNYNGHKAVKGTFDIVQASISTAKVETMQMIYKNPGKYLSKPFVSIDGVLLKTSDYTYKYYVGEEEITSGYKLSLADGETSKTVKIVVTGKENYTDTTAEGTYEVVRRGNESIDLTNAKIVAIDKVKGKDVSVAKQEYNGYAIEPEIRVMAKINKVWTDVDPKLYDVSYINNVNKGTATILVSGNGTETIGSKTARFGIKTMRFELFKLIFGK